MTIEQAKAVDAIERRHGPSIQQAGGCDTVTITAGGETFDVAENGDIQIHGGRFIDHRVRGEHYY